MKNNTARIKVRIVGITPLIMHAIPDELLFPGTGQSGGKPGKARSVHGGEEDEPREQAAKGLYTDGKGVPVLPLDNLSKCITQGGQFHKLGQKKITTRDSSLVPAAIMIEGDNFPVKPGKWEVYSKMVTNQVTKGKVPSHRPRFDEWTIEFVMTVDTTMFGLDLTRAIVDDAGSKIGLCSRRPETKGPFGRFRVDRWEIEKLPKTKEKS